MADIAASLLTDIAVSLLKERLADFLDEKVELSRDVRKEACELEKDLESMQSCVEAAETSTGYNDTTKTLLKQVKDAACDAEDALDEYMLRLGENRATILSCIKQCFKQLKHRHPIASKIRDIRKQIREIRERKEFYNFPGGVTQHQSGWNNHQASDPRLCAPLSRESQLVGIDEPRSELIEMLFGGEESRLTIAVVGMGGLGKTTLVQSVYEHAKEGEKAKEKKESFKCETHAWISVSKTFDRMDILRRMLVQFHKADGQQEVPQVNAMTETDASRALRGYLENKRFLLVLDDVWDPQAWRFLESALPERGHGGRVILTTRRRDVAELCDRTFNLRPLDPEEAWSLFRRNAFRTNEGNSCPPWLQEVARKIVDKCEGLPLAIVALGSHLSSKSRMYSEWNMILSSLGAELETDDYLKSMTRILMLSFNDLPHAVKSCFLFLSVFPEDYPIKRMKLIRLWIAEGLIRSLNGRSLEEVADGYLNQLIRRSLVQVAEWKHYEMVKACQVHDMVREIIISKYEKEGFFASSSSSVQNETMPSNVLRHLSICNQGETNQRYEEFTRLHSLFIFGADNASAISSFARLRFLRVVNLENVPMGSFPDGLTVLLFLRYLSLENTNIKNLPNSLGKLKNLETLNLKGTLVRELPNVILQLPRLRHLLVYQYGQGSWPFNSIGGVRVPPGIRNLRSLQKLGQIKAESGVVTELGNLTELRRLCVIKLRREDGNGFCISVAKMSHLQSLAVRSVDGDVVLDLQSLSCPPLTLQRLYLSGRLENLPEWIPSLHNLVALSLRWSKLRDDPLKALQSLPNLVKLELTNAYDGEELCCEAGGYPKLKRLCLSRLSILKQVKVENGAMSNLDVLEVSCCELLLEVRLCLQHLTNMELLCALDMPEKFLQSLVKDGGGEMFDDVQHIPTTHFHYHPRIGLHAGGCRNNSLYPSDLNFSPQNNNKCCAIHSGGSSISMCTTRIMSMHSFKFFVVWKKTLALINGEDLSTVKAASKPWPRRVS